MRALAFHPSGKYIASGSDDHTVKLWDLETSSEVRAFRGHRDTVYNLQFSPMGARVASSSRDGTVKVWRTDWQPERLIMPGHAFCRFSPDGRQIVTATTEGAIQLLSAEDGRVLRTLSGHSPSVFDAEFSPDGRYIASSGSDAVIRIWDARLGHKVTVLEGHEGKNTFTLAFCPKKPWLASFGEDQKLRIWNYHTGEELRGIHSRSRARSEISFHPNGEGIAISSEGIPGEVQVWNPNNGRLIQSLGDHYHWRTSLGFSADGRRLVTAGWDQRINIWDARNGKKLRVLQVDGKVNGFALSPDFKRIAVHMWGSGAIRVMDTEGGDEALTLREHSRDIVDLSFSPDGRLLSSLSSDGSLRLWDAHTNKFIR